MAAAGGWARRALAVPAALAVAATAVAAGGGTAARAQTGDWWHGDHDVLLGYGCTTLWLEVFDHRFNCPPGWRVHEGVDLDTPLGTPVYAGYSGVVTEVGGPERHDFGPHYVKVWLDEGHDVLLGHLSRATVAVGDRVYPGDRLGATGALGECNWPNLHFEVRPHRGTTYQSVDPTPYLHLSPDAVHRGMRAQTTGRLETIARFEYGEGGDPDGMTPYAGPPPLMASPRSLHQAAAWMPGPGPAGALAAVLAGGASVTLLALLRTPAPPRRRRAR